MGLYEGFSRLARAYLQFLVECNVCSAALICALMPWACPDRQQLAHSRSTSNPIGSGMGTYLPEVVLVESTTADLAGFTSVDISSMFWGQGVFSGWYLMLFIMSCVFAITHILQCSFCFLLSRRI